MKKIIIASGGTGGHIFPALCAGKYLREKGFEVIFVGRKNSFEEKIFKGEDFEMRFIDASGIKGKSPKEVLNSIIKTIKSIFLSLKILKKENPSAVIGFGGYISFPVICASRFLKIKNAICEQNAVMGFSNRISSTFSKNIFLNFINTYKLKHKEKAKVIGNFIKKEILSLKISKEEKDTILVFGGSQGAEKINEIVMKISKSLTEIGLRVVHITGERNFEKVKNFYISNNINGVEVIPFTNQMEEYYKRTKVVISRAGATSLTEFYALGLNAILIPYPYAADNHQWFNAAEYIKTGKGVILEQTHLTETKLLKWIRFFIKNDSRFKGEPAIMGDPFKAYEKLYNWVS